MKSYVIAGFLACLMPFVACADAARITVTGTGVVQAAPDMATVSLTVTQQDASARDAMRAASADVAAIIARLDGFAIDPRDRQTSGLSLDPVWSRHTSGNEERRITGYAARNTLTIRVRDLDQLGALLDAVLEDGANGFGGLSFGLQDPGPAQDAARQAAVRDALRTAGLLAEAAGATLGPIREITMGGAARSPGPSLARFEMAADAAAVPVEAGELDFRAQVTLVIEMAQ